MLKKGQNLPEGDHIMRFVPWARLMKDENEKVIGFFSQAFELRENENSLSVNWLEYFKSDHKINIENSVRAFRSCMNVGKKSAFWIALKAWGRRTHHGP